MSTASSSLLQAEQQEWLQYHKKKWAIQRKQRSERNKRRRMNIASSDEDTSRRAVRSGPTSGLGGFLRRTALTMLDMPWQIVQVDLFRPSAAVSSGGGGQCRGAP